MQKLEILRDKIDIIDDKLIDLLGERFSLVKEIGDIKKREQIPVLQSGRWEQVLNRVLEQGSQSHIPLDCIENIWNEIHKAALNLENKA